jgi:hypothetical protein
MLTEKMAAEKKTLNEDGEEENSKSTSEKTSGGFLGFFGWRSEEKVDPVREVDNTNQRYHF